MFSIHVFQNYTRVQDGKILFYLLSFFNIANLFRIVSLRAVRDVLVVEFQAFDVKEFTF